mmetsp:Transcript_23534/g.42457  ORF Transcript_23534/g.42457 Transcript_23534/m.42457 type:complete len:129 (+) Transcript_23534:590-976(+)
MSSLHHGTRHLTMISGFPPGIRIMAPAHVAQKSFLTSALTARISFMTLDMKYTGHVQAVSAVIKGGHNIDLGTANSGYHTLIMDKLSTNTAIITGGWTRSFEMNATLMNIGITGTGVCITLMITWTKL